MKHRPLWLILAALAPAAGTDTPIPVLQPGDVPARFEQKASSTAPLWPAADWWNGFADRQLSQLVLTAQRNNLDIAQAVARLYQADGRARQAGATLLPSIGFNSNINSLNGQSDRGSLRETDWGAGIGAAYELDFWGKNRNTARSAEALRRASIADRASVALTVTAAVADTYFKLLSLYERISVAKSNLKSAEDILGIVQRRVSAGFAAKADLIQQRASLAAERAVLPPLEQQEVETRNALAILLGMPPEGFAISDISLASIGQPQTAPGLPAEILTRRPDIVAAEANLVSAHADLQVARAAFLPSINLTASGGFAYPALSGAINSLQGGGLATAAGATLAQIIFDGGAIKAKSDEAKARENELLAAYRASVIAALSDVESAMARLDHIRAQEEAIRSQVAEAEKVLNAAKRKYTAGYSDFLVVTDAQRSFYAARDQLSDLRRANLSATVALFKALGGGWSAGTGLPGNTQ